MNERPIPLAAQRNIDAVEILRVWVAERQLHCSLKIGMYRDGMGIDEELAWGVILADAARHISKALYPKMQKPRRLLYKKFSTALTMRSLRQLQVLKADLYSRLNSARNRP
ncbi:DUF5076 domain-containing protein [Janthinobacterium aquaticum]|uniref:DUF5076 domain-containing protein n=1 Tax=Janthinobacterium sp. FT58W TaxID=2654254 RepID=UPI001264E7EC|nr:DUF5076 domain-containing protein [Janthinobacterium sp. FT58W]